MPEDDQAPISDTLSFDEKISRAAQRQSIWNACVGVAATLGLDPEDQALDALTIYRFALDIARDRHGVTV
jgi:hypothetical protein